MLSISKLLQQNSKPGGFAPLVDSLLQRVTESALADDRREAVQQLRDLLTDSPASRAAFGSVGLPLVCSLIRDSRDDVDLLRLALECLAAAVAPASPQVQEARVGLLQCGQNPRQQQAERQCLLLDLL